VSGKRLGHANSEHGITGSLGWALGPAVVVPMAVATNWRTALVVAGALAFGVLAILWFNRRRLELPRTPGPSVSKQAAPADADAFAFLRVPAVWMGFLFFLAYGGVLSGVQAFAPEAARQLHGVPIATAAACLTIYMLCSATGMVFGGFLASDAARSERVLAAGFGTAAVFALAVATLDVPAMLVPVIFGVMGLATGVAGPSRDLIVKKSAPENASGRVYGIVYSGLDIGQAVAPLLFGWLADHRMFAGVWFGVVAYQLLMIGGAFKVRRSRRTVLAPA
jgi:MFS family permease